MNHERPCRLRRSNNSWSMSYQQRDIVSEHFSTSSKIVNLESSIHIVNSYFKAFLLAFSNPFHHQPLWKREDLKLKYYWINSLNGSPDMLLWIQWPVPLNESAMLSILLRKKCVGNYSTKITLRNCESKETKNCVFANEYCSSSKRNCIAPLKCVPTLLNDTQSI